MRKILLFPIKPTKSDLPKKKCHRDRILTSGCGERPTTTKSAEPRRRKSESTLGAGALEEASWDGTARRGSEKGGTPRHDGDDDENHDRLAASSFTPFIGASASHVKSPKRPYPFWAFCGGHKIGPVFVKDTAQHCLCYLV